MRHDGASTQHTPSNGNREVTTEGFCKRPHKGAASRAVKRHQCFRSGVTGVLLLRSRGVVLQEAVDAIDVVLEMTIRVLLGSFSGRHCR